MFVIVRQDGKFVALAGAKQSYTRALNRARIFQTEAAARADCCGNERVRNVRDIVAVTTR